LASVIERAAILGHGLRLEIAGSLGTVGRQTLAADLPQPRPPEPDPVTSEGAGRASFPSLDAAMARHIEDALRRTRGRIEGPDGAAVLLRINPHTLRARMRKLGVNWETFRAART
jgi:transcriptional regulator with GAF, ATPase, and Fis domain